jgi:hypothetical protein
MSESSEIAAYAKREAILALLHKTSTARRFRSENKADYLIMKQGDEALVALDDLMFKEAIAKAVASLNARTQPEIVFQFDDFKSRNSQDIFDLESAFNDSKYVEYEKHALGIKGIILHTFLPQGGDCLHMTVSRKI